MRGLGGQEAQQAGRERVSLGVGGHSTDALRAALGHERRGPGRRGGRRPSAERGPTFQVVGAMIW